MIKKIEFNPNTNHINNIFHNDVPIDYVLLEGHEIVERDFEHSIEKGWQEVPSLDVVKSNKIKELDELCKATILGRFTAVINTVEYEFSYDAEAQSRFNGIGVLFLSNKIQEIEWTAYQNGERVRITLNSANFDIVSLQALQHQNTNIIKFNQLLQQVNEAITKEQVEAIVW